LAALQQDAAELDKDAREQMINRFAHAVGAVVLSRACPDDSPLADEILDVCRKAMTV
jgi:TetR/AcrR family transcriptional repressor of nem operon